ncbi:putative OPA3-like protein CG13603 isoform X1 [Plutella xylostella]|uniref:putative OPA3-like protein CG13603 isoform X1 n=1 Tax=Plutella xylostella TaxID=51655 RepID=UPI00203282C7|nr:putative OPA3-like protein CG13603 isoform X1 [Plutella xylostella]
MVVGAFPIAKLAVLLVKQISKPIANACKERAKHHPFFRTYVCMPPAQFYNWCEVKAKMWVLNLGKPVNIPVLSQEMAIELGANLLGEGIIFVIGAGLLFIEYNRQSNKEAVKEAKREEEMKHINSTLSDLFFTVQQQQAQLREMERVVVELASKPAQPGKVKPSPKKSDEGPGSGAQPGKTPPVTNCDYIIEKTPLAHTPYPNTGFILRSLNYIQMDVLSSSAFTGTATNKVIEKTAKPEGKPAVTTRRRDQAIVTGALNNIENDFRSLF